MTRTPRPFICSKKVRLRTFRMKKTTSSGLTSVPVAIMSTVTAMRGMTELQNALSRSSGFAPVVLYVIFWQKSLPLPNVSLAIRTMSSAWLSSFAKMSVLGTSSRPGNISGSAFSRKVCSTVRIWSSATTLRSRSDAV